jgi:hypothetical protein
MSVEEISPLEAQIPRASILFLVGRLKLLKPPSIIRLETRVASASILLVVVGLELLEPPYYYYY